MTRWRSIGSLSALLCWSVGCGGAESADPPASTPTASDTVEAAPASTPDTEPKPEVDQVAASCESLAEAAAQTLSIESLFDFVVPGDLPVAQEIWETLAAPLGECLDAGRGAWVAVPTAVRMLTGERTPAPASPEAPGRVFELDYELTYVAPDGTEHRSATKTLRHQITDNVPEGQKLTLYPPQDLDGDGVGELASVVTSFGPDFGETEDVILQFREGGIAPIDDFGEMRLTDHDRDGRFDVIVQRPWRCTFFNDMEGSSYEAGCPSVLLHGVEGGVSGDDEVARAYLRTLCPRRPTELVSEDPPDYCWPERGSDHLRVGCARVWGASVAEVQAQVRREYGRLRAECRSEGQHRSLLAHAAHEPPLTLE